MNKLKQYYWTIQGVYDYWYLHTRCTPEYDYWIFWEILNTYTFGKPETYYPLKK